MPIQDISDIKEGIRIGVWRLDETVDELRSRVVLNEAEEQKFLNFTNERRKKEWLAIRCLLHEMKPNVSIIYCEDGKPYLDPHKGNISLSHTKGWVTVVLSEKYKIGCDIERKSPKVIRIKDKFSSLIEQTNAKNQDSDLSYYTLIWSSKEAIYKQFFHLESLEFKTQIIVKIEDRIGNVGEIEAEVLLAIKRKKIRLKYFVNDEYVLVYTLND